MKKCLSVVLSVMLILSMALGMTGCGGSDADKIIGTWEGEMDMAEVLNEGMDLGDAEIAEFLHAASFPVILQFTFNEDGTYKFGVDAEALKETFSDYAETFKSGLEDYFEQMLSESGMEMSVDDLFTQMGVTLDDMVAEVLNDDMVQETVDSMTMEGKYKVEDGKLFMSEGLEYEVDENVYDTYELDGKTLKLIEPVGQELEDFEKNMYPMTLTKVQ